MMATFESWLRRMPPGGHGRRQRRRPAVSRPSWTGSPTGPARSSPMRSSTRRHNGWAATPARSPSDSRRRAARRASLLGRVTASDPASTTLELHGLDPLAGPITARLSTAGPPQRGQRPGRRGRRGRRSASRPAAIGDAPRDLRRHRPPARAQGRGRRRRRLRRLWPPPDRHPRDPRGGPAARTGPAASGRSTSR